MELVPTQLYLSHCDRLRAPLAPRAAPAPSIQIQGRKEELLEPHVSLPVCSKTVLLCDFLGLFSWFRGCTKVRLGTLESIASVSGALGCGGKGGVSGFGSGAWQRKGDGGDFFPVR